MTEPQPITRDRSHVEREYGRDKWPEVVRLIEDTIAAEATPARLSRVIGEVARFQWPKGDPPAPQAAVAGGTRVELPRVSAYGGQRYLIMEVLKSVCTDRTELIVELGSGWGWHVLSLWLDGGPRDALYVGAEYTEPGRRAAARLAELEPELRFESLAFDYNNPAEGLGQLGRVQEAVVFTQHSIEQIPQVRPEVVDAIAALGERVRCVHFEPIGWQLDQDGREGSSQSYADQHDYNRNLVETLREAEGRGRIAIDATVPEVVGVNPSNSTSVVSWHSPSA
jgi:hypothetical protein